MSKVTANEVEEKGDFSEDEESEEKSEYYRKLRSLNETFLRWIQDFMTRSPHYIFTPVCKEYIAYIEKIESEFGSKSGENSGQKVSAELAAKQAINSCTATLTSAADTSSSTASTSNAHLMFDFPVNHKKAKLELSDKVSSASNSPEGVFQVKPMETVPEEREENNEYQPPKTESVVIEESDAVFSKKCKLYYKKDTAFIEKGVGMLYVKKQAEGKHQLLMRADTTLGNILLNIQLHSSLPLSVSKKGVLLTCVPNPPIDVKKKDDMSSVTFFIRVKNESEANDLLKQLSNFAGKE